MIKSRKQAGWNVVFLIYIIFNFSDLWLWLCLIVALNLFFFFWIHSCLIIWTVHWPDRILSFSSEVLYSITSKCLLFGVGRGRNRTNHMCLSQFIIYLLWCRILDCSVFSFYIYFLQVISHNRISWCGFSVSIVFLLRI